MEKKAIAYLGLCPKCKTIQRHDLNKSVPCTICGNPIPSWKEKTAPPPAEPKEEETTDLPNVAAAKK